MITICFTYRDRDLKIVERALQTLKYQSDKNFDVSFIDYGSSEEYRFACEKLLNNFSFAKYYYFDTERQLWNKAKAINFALKKCINDYFFVADIDMLFRNDFIEKLNTLKSYDKAIFFKVGYLTKVESSTIKLFEDYLINHYSNDEATGMTLYPKDLVLQINGFDEFYHGWGSEDTDVHIRLKNKGNKVVFWDSEVLLIHQWHAKEYRTKNSLKPFHSNLEKINMFYCKQAVQQKKVLANVNFPFGNEPFIKEKKSDFKILVTNQKSEIDALRLGSLQINQTTELIIKEHVEFKSLKNVVKKIVGKKHKVFYTMDEVNNLLLEILIIHYRNNSYDFMNEKKQIKLIIYPINL